MSNTKTIEPSLCIFCARFQWHQTRNVEGTMGAISTKNGGPSCAAKHFEQTDVTTEEAYRTTVLKGVDCKDHTLRA